MTTKEEFRNFLETVRDHLLDENISLDENQVSEVTKEVYGNKTKPLKVKRVIIEEKRQEKNYTEEVLPDYDDLNVASELKSINALKDIYKDNELVEFNDKLLEKIELISQLNEQPEEECLEPTTDDERLIYETVFGDNTDKSNPIIEDFIKFSKNYLKLKWPVNINFTDSRDSGITTAGYNPNDKSSIIYIKSRAVVDILRSIAHELVHQKQHEEGELTNDSGKTGSPHENQANSIAGILMREYQKDHPEIYNESI
jgi:hypothetical protein